MADWMDEAVKRTREKFGAQRVADEKFVREDKRKRELGDQFYSSLRAWLYRAEKEFNAKYGSQVLIVTEAEKGVTIIKASLTRTDSKQAELSYNDILQKITWVTGTGDTEHVIRLKLSAREDGMVAESGTQEWTVETFGQKIIDGVLP